jgi:hypothetical protein
LTCLADDGYLAQDPIFMKKILCLFMLTALPSAAQWRHFGSEPTTVTGYFGGGFSEAINPAARTLDTGWNLAGGVGVTSKYVGVMLDAMFNDFGINHSTLRRVGATDGSQRYWAVTVDPVFHVNRKGPVDFYLTGGGGIYSQVTDFNLRGGFRGPFRDGDLNGTYILYKPGVDGGAGFSFNLDPRSRVQLFVEARFHHMFTGTGVSFVPVSVGVRF